MKLSDLRRRLADAIAPSDIPEKPFQPNVTPPELDPLDAQPITPIPGEAKPLTAEQRANLEDLRDRYAPDRQHGRLADQIGHMRHSSGQNAE